MPARTFPYQRQWGVLLLALLFFVGCGAFLGWRAATNDRGLIINGILELGVTGATWFFAILAVVSFAFIGLGAFAMVRSFGASVGVDDEALTIPRALRGGSHRIAYRDVSGLEIVTVSGQEFLTVRHGSRNHSVGASLVGAAALREIVELVEARVSAANDEPRAGG